MSHKLIYTNGGGRLGNQILSMANFMAFTLEHPDKHGICNINFLPYSHLFKKNYNIFDIAMPYSQDRLHKFGRWFALKITPPESRQQELFWKIVYPIMTVCPGITKYSPSQMTDITSGDDRKQLFDLMHQNRFILNNHYGFRCWDWVKKHRDEIIKKMQFDDAYADIATPYVAALYKKCDMVVGVQIRQRDYRLYRDGEYFYEADDYLAFMKQIEKLYPNKKVGFLITSDEEQDKNLFQDFIHEFGPGAPMGHHHYVSDICALSLCDLIIAPPSTFSVWAAFIGAVDYIPLLQKNIKLSQDMIMKDALFDCLNDPLCNETIH